VWGDAKREEYFRDGLVEENKKQPGVNPVALNIFCYLLILVNYEPVFEAVHIGSAVGPLYLYEAFPSKLTVKL
jgi:hypothetical protein